MCGHIRRDMIRIEVIRGRVGSASVEDKMREVSVRSSVQVNRRCSDALERRRERLLVARDMTGRGKLKKNKGK